MSAEAKTREPLACGACGKVLEKGQKDAECLSCKVHPACSMGCSDCPCKICVCDACGKTISAKMEACLCGCIYHERCQPMGRQEEFGCLWCEPVSSANDIVARREALSSGRVSLHQPDPDARHTVYLSEKKMLAHGWAASHLLSLKHYRGVSVLSAGIPHASWKKLGFSVEEFARLEVNPVQFIVMYFHDLSADEFRRVAMSFKKLTFMEAMVASSTAIEQKYGAKYTDYLVFFKDLRERGITGAILTQFHPKEAELLHWASGEQWDFAFNGIFTTLFRARPLPAQQ